MLAFVTCRGLKNNRLSFVFGFLAATFLFFFLLSDSKSFNASSHISYLHPGIRENNSGKEQLNNAWTEEPINSTTSTNDLNSLNKNIRVFCWIMSYPENTNTKAKAVNQTWLKRCDGAVFVTAKANSTLPQIPESEKLPNERKKLWHKTRAAFEWIYKNKINDYDWFLKADDDTYFLMDNLKLLLLNYNPDDPLYLGCMFKMHDPKRYMSGGAGYVLSRKALELLGSMGLSDENICRPANKGNYEDLEMGRCMMNLNVTFIDTRDRKHRHRMFPSSLSNHLGLEGPNKTKWLQYYMAFPYKDGKEMLSEYVVSFHYTGPNMMYILDHALYNIRHIGDEKSLLSSALAASWNIQKPTGQRSVACTVASDCNDFLDNFVDDGEFSGGTVARQRFHRQPTMMKFWHLAR